jgi:hypothetical protein
MQIKGKIHEIGNTIPVTETFFKREFIIEYAENPKYLQYINFQVIQDKCSILDNYEIGQEVDVYFNLQGKPYKNKKGETHYFNSLQVWKLNPAVETEQKVDLSVNQEDDLPF